MFKIENGERLLPNGRPCTSITRQSKALGTLLTGQYKPPRQDTHGSGCPERNNQQRWQYRSHARNPLVVPHSPEKQQLQPFYSWPDRQMGGIRFTGVHRPMIQESQLTWVHYWGVECKLHTHQILGESRKYYLVNNSNIYILTKGLISIPHGHSMQWLEGLEQLASGALSTARKNRPLQMPTLHMLQHPLRENRHCEALFLHHNAGPETMSRMSGLRLKCNMIDESFPAVYRTICKLEHTETAKVPIQLKEVISPMGKDKELFQSKNSVKFYSLEHSKVLPW